jgi:hypothetical protein
MKIRKTISEKVISANRANSQKSTGPEDCANVKNNAMKHGFRAQQLFFENQDEKKDTPTCWSSSRDIMSPMDPRNGCWSKKSPTASGCCRGSTFGNRRK